MNKAITFIRISFLFALLLGCKNASSNQSTTKNNQEEAEQAPSGFWVKNSGNRQDILNVGKLSATVSLDSLLSIPNLYAIGPIEGLQGEITVYNGHPSIATIEGDAPKFSTTAAHTKAIFLVYGSCSQWQKIEINKPLYGLVAIENYVKAQLESNDFGTETPVLFKINGKVSSLDYHIIYKKDDAPHNKEEHQKAKQKYTLDQGGVSLIGFWADAAGEGVYTHNGKRTHLHFLSADKSISGHLDDIQLEKGATLLLPKME
jgi:acetolactate decarboxylase